MILIVVSAIAAAAAGGSARPARAGSVGKGGITVAVPLPAVQQSSAETLTFTVSAPAGKTVGPLRVRTANDAKLGNLAVVYVVGTPKKASARESVTVSVLIKRFLSRRLASKADEPSVEMQFSGVTTEYTFTLTKKNKADCGDLKFYDSAFESGVHAEDSKANDYFLLSGRSGKVQSSPPEEVLDNVLAGIQVPAGCDFKPEGDDPGGK